MAYSDPLRSEERSMNPEFAQHEMRDPGLKVMRPHMSGGMRSPRMGGLGSMHHTMPHLMRRSGMPHFDGGGLLAGIAANQASNTMNPDAQFRSFMQLMGQRPVGSKLPPMSSSPSFNWA